MSHLLLLLPIAATVLCWAGYHYYSDRRLPEPPLNLFVCFLLGILSFFLGKACYGVLYFLGLRSGAYELALSSPIQLFAYCMAVIGPIEELVKFLPFFVIVLRFKAFDEPIDGIIYASFIALGFAAVENIHYLQHSTVNEVIARGLAGPLVHAMFASVWGYYIGKTHLQRKPLFSCAFGVLAFAILLHGLYDFIVIGYPQTLLPLSAGLILLIWIWRIRLIKDLHQQYH